jgi:hypothetical protein
LAGIVTKGQIGYEDIATGTSTFTRTTSTGGTQVMHQLPFTVAGGNITILGSPTIASPTITGTDTGTETLVNKTLSTSTLTSPVINGTPSGTGIPTITLKKGSGGGNYSSASTSYVDVDAANLGYTVTIPTGWKLAVSASGNISVLTAAVLVSASLFDSSTLVETEINPNAASAIFQFTLNWVITGDGNSHTVKLQYKTSNGSDSVQIINNSATLTPTILFTLTPSN